MQISTKISRAVIIFDNDVSRYCLSRSTSQLVCSFLMLQLGLFGILKAILVRVNFCRYDIHCDSDWERVYAFTR